MYQHPGIEGGRNPRSQPCGACERVLVFEMLGVLKNNWVIYIPPQAELTRACTGAQGTSEEQAYCRAFLMGQEPLYSTTHGEAVLDTLTHVRSFVLPTFRNQFT